jgi:DNA-binding NarL/FixJ family response regulator
MLEAHPQHFAVCGEADSAAETLRVLRDARPDVAIVDLSLDGGNGLELVKKLTALEGHPQVLVYSMHDEALFAERSLRAGAKGYLNKQESTEAVYDAIRRVASGRMYLSAAMTDRLLSRQVAGGTEIGAESEMTLLSDRELEVFELIGQGVATRQIAERLHLSPKTIETYRENIKHKLGLANAAELAQHAVQWVLTRG